MKKAKKKIRKIGKLLRPLVIGQGAYVYIGGVPLHTSRVVAIYEQTEELVHFETMNSDYYLTTRPFPTAVINPLPVSLAA